MHVFVLIINLPIYIRGYLHFKYDVFHLTFKVAEEDYLEMLKFVSLSIIMCADL